MDDSSSALFSIGSIIFDNIQELKLKYICREIHQSSSLSAARQDLPGIASKL
jgi:hypothetical protein